MKHVQYCIAWCLTLCLSQALLSQTTGIPFTAEYSVQPVWSHTLETDVQDNVTKAINIVPGKGKHSVMGEVTTFSIVHFDTTNGDNVIEFTETDKDGNSIFVKTKGSPHKAGWKCYGAIIGGTGKYKTATGSYTAIGTSDDNGSAWTAEGILFYQAEDDEKVAIKKVIIDETQSYMVKDFQVHDNTYVIADYTSIVNNVPEGTANLIYPYTHNQVPVRDQEMIDSMIDFDNVDRSDWNIQIRGEVAWVIFNQKLNALGKRWSSIETRVLEKINGDWKIAHASSVYNSKTAVSLESSK